MKSDPELRDTILRELDFLKRAAELLADGRLVLYSRLEGRSEDISPIAQLNTERLIELCEALAERLAPDRGEDDDASE